MLKRTSHVLRADPGRVIAKPYLPGEEISSETGTRAGLLMARILALPEDDVVRVLDDTLRRFNRRHREFEALLERHFALVAHRVTPASLSRERRLLIGAYFTNEYSIEGAALCNPSIVEAPDQGTAGTGKRRFIMSLRAVGEGHISSIELRTGVIDSASRLTFDPLSPYLVTGDRAPPATYDKRSFRAKLVELDAGNDVSSAVLAVLPERFTLGELEHSLGAIEREGTPHAISYETAKIIRVLAASSYVVTFPSNTALSERVIFPRDRTKPTEWRTLASSVSSTTAGP